MGCSDCSSDDEEEEEGEEEQGAASDVGMKTTVSSGSKSPHGRLSEAPLHVRRKQALSIKNDLPQRLEAMSAEKRKEFEGGIKFLAANSGIALGDSTDTFSAYFADFPNRELCIPKNQIISTRATEVGFASYDGSCIYGGNAYILASVALKIFTDRFPNESVATRERFYSQIENHTAIRGYVNIDSLGGKKEFGTVSDWAKWLMDNGGTPTLIFKKIHRCNTQVTEKVVRVRKKIAKKK
jgi:hypothetical protein